MAEPDAYRPLRRLPRGARRRLSVVLPVRNEGALLQLTVLSLLHNTDYPDFEILVCDQGSEDGCCDFLRWPRFAGYSNLRYIDCSASTGPNGTRNTGLQHASGHYLMVLDAHMAVEPGWAERLLTAWLSFGDPGLIGCNIPDIYDWSSRRRRYVYTTRDLGLFNVQRPAQDLIDGRYAESPNIPGGCTFTSRDYFESSGGFDPGMRGWGFNDVEYSMRTWLSGYRCIMVTDLHISHYYKRAGQPTFKVDNVDYQYNRLRHLFTNFPSPDVRARILTHIAGNDAFEQARRRIEADPDYARYRSERQARFCRDDRWWIHRFATYLDPVFLSQESDGARAGDAFDGDIARLAATPGAMGGDEYRAIADRLAARAPCNLLVFGHGADATLWQRLNAGGHTLFLEADEAPGGTAIVPIRYGTRLGQWRELLERPDALMLDLPADVAQAAWDVIIVDGPPGFDAATPGRMRSIYSAAALARRAAGSEVFVHDCHREVEHTYAERFLGTPHRRVQTLQHYRFP